MNYTDKQLGMLIAEEVQFSEAEAIPVVVRTNTAGVHYGYLRYRKGSNVLLTKSRRIYNWKGAWTLSEIAVSGVDRSKSKIAAPITLMVVEAVEIIACSDAARDNLDTAVWAT